METSFNDNSYRPALRQPIYPRWPKSRWSIIIAALIIIGLMFLAAAAFTYFNLIANPVKINGSRAAKASEETPAEIQAKRLLIEKMDRPHFGNPEAKIIIVEFADFQCPLCHQEFPIIREIMQKYQNEIFYLYRNFPTIDENSLTLARAGFCAQAQDKFWPLHDKLFQNTNETFSLIWLDNLAKQAGLDWKKFDDCLKNNLYQSQLVEDINDANAAGVRGTPTFFVSGVKFEGVYSLENWQVLIDGVSAGLKENQ